MKAPKKTKSKKSKKKTGDYGFFLLHIEKIVLGCIVLVFLWLAVGSMGAYPSLSWQPNDLSGASDQAKNRIDTNEVSITDIDPSLYVIDYDAKAKWIKQEVNISAFTTPTKWEPTLFPERIPRGEPKILAITKLRAVPGSGAILVQDKDPRRTAGASRGGPMGGAGYAMDPMGGGGGYGGGSGTVLEGRRWIVLTGLIPIKEQLQEYVNTYSEAMYQDPMRDRPNYVACEIERCEYDPTPGATLVWKKLETVKSFDEQMKTWAGTGAEQVDSSYLAPAIPGTMPIAYYLPPLAHKLFGEEVAYPPYVPLLSDSLVETLGIQDELIKQIQEQESRPIDLNEMLEQFNKSLGASSGGMGGSMGYSSMGGPMGGDSMMGGPMGGGMSMGGSSRMGGVSGRMSGPSGMMGGGGGLMRAPTRIQVAPPALVDHYLFRYFDFDVQQDKSYQYRVKLILSNPNVKLNPKLLETPEFSVKPALFSESCEPSAPVTVGRTARVLAKEALAPPSRQPWREPSAKISSIYFDIEGASEWVDNTDRTLLPGQLANFPGAACYAPSLSRQSGGMGPGGGGVSPMMTGRPTASQSKAPTSKTVDIETNISFLDVYGGYALDGGDRSPGKLLLMEPNGTLVIRDIAKDLDESQKYQRPTQQRGRSGR